ncbi:MAG: ATP-binding protein [Treponema sp.]|jgi:predicted AAA+ superfamily ATPase|nr:ATP-binding protein [Treponema sp.]
MFKRKLADQLKTRMRERRLFMQAVIGPRQTGKTTAVLQALEELDKPYHFISADDPSVVSLEWLRNEWEKARLMCKQSKKETILAIDEVQKVPQWSSLVKFLWDEDTRKKTPVKVILSGSSSLLIQKGLSESMAGRFEVLFCPHWNYQECKAAFKYTLDDFLFFGGYPGAAALKDDVERWSRYMGSSIVEPVMSKDVFMMEDVRKPALLRSLFVLGAAYSAQELSYTKILGQLHDAGNTVTLAHYLELLDNANILCGLSKYASNKIRSRQSSPRLMVYDSSLLIWAAGASRMRFLEMPDSRGHLVETSVGAYLLARGKEEGFSVYWWRDRDKEVDFVIEKGKSTPSIGGALTAIEVKSGRVKHIGGSMEFMRRYPDALGITVGDGDCRLEDFLSGKIPLFKE